MSNLNLIVMKKLLTILLSLSILFAIGQSTNPTAVNDTVFDPVKIGEFVTVLVTANDYDEDGDEVLIKLAPGSNSNTDTTITYFIDYSIFGGVSDKIVFNYFIEDENGNSGPNSTAKVVLTNIENNGFEFLDVNNISARFNAFGNHFWDMPGGVGSQYAFPKGSSQRSIFNFVFWLGGIDESSQLRIAAERYQQQGNDYWTGPLSFNNQEAWIDTTTVAQWFKIWKLSKEEVEYHALHWNDPGYVPIENILSWPAHGNVDLGQSFHLAPFIDINNDTIYDPITGDYPLIRGDQTLFFIFNDQLPHTETGGQPIGIEIHGFAYAFNMPDDPQLNNTTFLSYKIFNRSQHTLTNTYAGLFSDIDLGSAWDDYVGCDISRGAFYCYNGEEIDGNGEPEAYGANPPAQGIIVLGGPYMDSDGNDNPANQCDESINGVGFGDGVVDNERYGMNNFIYFNNTGFNYQVDPQTDYEYYNYLKGIWRDSTVMEYGGNGHASSGAYGPAAKFMFPGTTDPCNWGTAGEPPYGPVEWTEETAENPPGDRRGLCSMGPFTLEPNGFHKIDVAFVTARGDSIINSVDLLMEYIDSVKTFYYEDPDHFGYQYLGNEELIINENKIMVYPNPASSEIYVQYKTETNNAQYVIFNSFGAEALSGKLNNNGIHQINLSGLEEGFYILQIKDGSRQKSCKVLKK